MTEVSYETGLIRSLASELQNADVKGTLTPWHQQMTVAAETWPALSGLLGGSDSTHTMFCETVGQAVTVVHDAVTGVGAALTAVADHYVEVETANTVG